MTVPQLQHSPYKSAFRHRDRCERVMLVDRSDHVIGVGPKLEVHRTGQLHRAFSVLVTDGEGRMLLQRRADTKYHFSGLWSNACCGHPRPGEATVIAARRRLQEEFGFALAVNKTAEMRYRAHDGVSGLVENEYLHVFHGSLDRTEVFQPDPEEIGAWRWINVDTLRRAMHMCPQVFTPWFLLLFERYATAIFAAAGNSSRSA